MPVPISAIYASVLAIVFVILSYRVARRRVSSHVGLGTGDNRELERLIRIQGNFAEYVPLALLLLLIYEFGGGPAWAIHLAGAALLIARLLHAAGLTRSSGRTTGRFTGIIATWLVILGLALVNLVNVLA